MKTIILLSLLLGTAACVHAHTDGSSIAEPDTCAHLDEVVVTGVTGSARVREIAAPVSVVSHEALLTHLSTNIIDAVSRQPGISQITTGSGISKPVIRGLGYNRVLVVSDGIRQEGQQWGDEHGVEIDGQGVHSVEILKGPASLMYGSDAMAGVIIMHDAPVMPQGEIYAEAGTEYQTNNGLISYTLNSRGNRGGVVWNWRWSRRWAHDYRAPEDGLVTGSRFRERALSGMIGANRHWGHSHLKLSYYQLTPGMTEVDDGYGSGSHGYAVEAPFQQVQHYKAVSDNSFRIGEGMVKAIVGYQQNRRREYEEKDECSLDFRLHSVNYDIRYVSPLLGGWKTNVGVSGMYQQSDNLGSEYLIPAYRLFDTGVFATVSKTLAGRAHISGGLRYDHRRLHSLSLYDDGDERFADFRRNFGALSGSIGIIYNVSGRLDLKANVSHGFRAPNMSELGSNGEHEGTFRYEQGNSDLKPERSWQFDVGLDYSSELFSASVALFVNNISNYIFMSRTASGTDETTRHAHASGNGMSSPVYRFTSGDARTLGGEARLIFHLMHHLHFENTFSYVDARLLHAAADSRYLPFTPAPRWLSMLHYDIPLRSHVVKGLFAEAEADINFRQNKVFKANDTETPTPAYTLFNLNIGADIMVRGNRKLCSVGINAANILNCAYQSHLSRLKYAGTLPFTGRSGINNMGRNIGFKLLFPLYF